MHPSTPRAYSPAHHRYSRRRFLQATGLAALAAPALQWFPVQAALGPARDRRRVALAACPGYGEEVRGALRHCFDLLGGLGSLVKGKTVTVKVNLTGTDFQPALGRPVGELYMTHFATGYALAQLLLEAGARRVRFAESTNSRDELQTSLGLAGWDIKALEGLGRIEFENTRNLGSSKTYGSLPVPFGGHFFSRVDFNRAYTDTDVLVSMCKLKQHLTAAVTLSLKNLFGITPNALYGDGAGDEDATRGRGFLHDPTTFKPLRLPGAKEAPPSRSPFSRIPRIVVDICAARPIDLAIIDGITSICGGEGPWCKEAEKVAVMKPGIVIAGLNPVCTDAVGMAVMGYPDPQAPRGQGAFKFCDNTLLLAEQAGLGTADLKQVEMCGLPLEKARCPYPELEVAKQVDRALKAAAQNQEL